MASKSSEVGTLWSFPLSFAAQKARLGLEEKHIPYEVKNVNILLGKHYSPSYLRINGNATVPSFIKGDFKLTDSTDILRYADSIDGPLGGSEIDSAKVEEWYALQGGWDDNLYTFGKQGLSTAFLLTNFRASVLEARKKENPDLAALYDQKLDSVKKTEEDLKTPEVLTALHEKLILILDTAEKQLTETKYLAGNAFSMADVVLVTILNRVEVVSENKLIEERAAVASFWHDAKKRPSYQKVIAPVAGAKALPTIVGVLASISFRNLFKRY